LAEDLLTGTYWMDMRKAQNPARAFGGPPTAVWTAFRATLPFDGSGAASAMQPIHEIAASFIRGNAAANFYKDNSREPDVLPRRHITE
jgi:histidine ammonia-lyase